MPDWGKIFADPLMQRLPPNPEVMALVPELTARGVRRVLDAGCGAGRHLMPLVRAGFQVLGLDREWPIVRDLRALLDTGALPLRLAQADLQHLPFPAAAFDFVLSINAISHGDARAFGAYCRELDRVLVPGGFLFIYVSPREFGDLVRTPQTLEPEPGTLVRIATPDGDLVHHFPTPESLAACFPRYTVHRLETVQAPIPFMNGAQFPQLVFFAEK